MQKARLLKLAAFMENLPEAAQERFNMGSWAIRPYRVDGTYGVPDMPKETQRIDAVDCGTAGCLLGWAPSCFPRSKLVIEFRQGTRYGFVEYTDSHGKYYDEDAGAKFFGLTDEQANFLFMPGHYSEYCADGTTRLTPKHAADQIRRLVKEPSIAD